MNEKLNVYQRIAAIMGELSYLQKDKKVEGYMAITHDQVTALTRPLFLKHGVLVCPRQLSGATVATGKATKSGTPIIRYEGKYEVDFVNIEAPDDKMIVPIEAHAEDHGDKAPGKCVSYATKTAILKRLQLETGEGDEGRVRREPEDESEGLDEKARADLMASLDEAATLEDLQTRTKHALQVAAQLGDVVSHKAIKERGIELSKKFAKNGARATQ